MPKFLSLVAAGLALVSSSSATCANPTQRKAWTKLTDTEKSDYLKAAVCLTETPSKTGFGGAKTIWDEFQAAHVSQVQMVHGVGAFFPWHRYYMKAHETQLRGTCGYTGPLPYWDQQADQAAAPMEESSIWGTTLGFGSPVLNPDTCVTDGPFAGLTYNVDIHLNKLDTPACLSRGLNQKDFDLVSYAEVDKCMGSTTYADWNGCAFGNIHVDGHYAVGGTMIDISLSPIDPLFFMHHTNLDRLWWEWQQQNLTARLTDMSGVNVGFYDILIKAQPPSYPPSAFIPYFYESSGDGSQTTLNHTLWMNEILPNVTIADVMDIGGDVICSVYV